MLKIRPLEATYKKDHDTFSKMDPYAIFECDGKKFQTKAQKDSGVHPKWTEEFIIKTKDLKQKTMKITTWDDDPLKDDYIGGAQVNLMMWMQDKNQLKVQDVNLQIKGELVAIMRIQYYFDPDVEPQEKTKFIL